MKPTAMRWVRQRAPMGRRETRMGFLVERAKAATPVGRLTHIRYDNIKTYLKERTQQGMD
jgi:hypothetical protein